MKSITSQKSVRSILSLVFVLALFFTCFGAGESNALNAGQSEETELESVNAELEQQKAEDASVTGPQADGHEHSWRAATYSQPMTCTVCGETYGSPATKTVAPTLAELQAIIDSGKIRTVSERGVSLTLPSASQLLDTPYRAYIGNRAYGRIYVMPVSKDGNGTIGMINAGTEVWILAKIRGGCFFVADNGVMGWNNPEFFEYEATPAENDAVGDPMELETLRQQTSQAQYDEFRSAVSAYDSDLLLPAQESLMLPSQRVVKYVQGSYGQGILLTRDRERKISTLPDGTKVTIYAIENGGAFVQVSDGRYGWTVLRLLTEKYDEELHHQRLVDYITREKKLWTSSYWRSFILDNADDFPAEVVTAAKG